jgi:hypothetical protein
LTSQLPQCRRSGLFQNQHSRSMGRPERTFRPECLIRENDRTGVGSLRR